MVLLEKTKHSKTPEMKKLLTFLTLSFVFTLQVNAQNDFEPIGQYSAKLAHSGYDTVGQSFLLQESAYVENCRLVVFSRYSLFDHPAILSILEGDGPYGQVISQRAILVRGVNKFFSEDTLSSLTSAMQIENLWTELQISIDSGVLGFDELATTFPIGDYLPAGQYTLMVSLDTTIVSAFGYRWITSFTNCYNWPCASPYNIDPYPNGTHYWGLDMLLLQNDERDMAFEVNLRRQDISTNISEVSGYFQANTLTVPEDWVGSSLSVYDVAGREMLSLYSLRTGQQVSVPANQVVLLSLTSRTGVRKTVKVFRSDL